VEIHVYDTYARKKNGEVIHFDVFLPERDNDKAFECAKEYLEQIGEDSNSFDQKNCRFCHSQEASEEVAEEINNNGHYIYKMEGCPK